MKLPVLTVRGKAILRCCPVIATIVLSLAVSCTYKDLCYNHEGHSGKKVDVLIRMDWGNPSEYPTGMTLMFFPQDGSAPFKYITNSVDSTVFSLPVGTYDVVAFNQTVEEYRSIAFHDMDSWDGMYISIADDEEMPGYSREPAEFLVATKTGFIVAQNITGSAGDDYVVMDLKTHPIAVTTTVRVLVSGLQWARGANGHIDGMAKRFYLTRNCTGRETTSFALNGWTVTRNEADGDKLEQGIISKSFVSFGLPGVHYTQENLEEGSNGAYIEPVQNLRLSVNILLVDMETTISADFNVSDRYSFPENVFNMLVEVGSPPVELPEVQGQAGGFIVTVEDWGDEVRYDVTL